LSIDSENGLGKLVSQSGKYWESCALHAAVGLDLFTLLGASNLSATQIAEKADYDPRALELLLNAITAMGLLASDGENFSNTPYSKKYLSKESENYSGHIIMHHAHLVESWSRLDETIKTGKPVARRSIEKGAEEREAFLMGMFNIAVGVAPFVAKAVDLGGKRRLLDLGGGPGTYAVYFCLENPELNAVVYDLPETGVIAEKIRKRFALDDRIEFIAGDFCSDPIPGKYDVLFISHILHGQSPSECEALISKACSTLEPGATVMVQEFFLDDSKQSPLFPALFSLNMLLNNQGRAYSEKEVRTMLEKAGVAGIEPIPHKTPNGAYVVKGKYTPL